MTKISKSFLNLNVIIRINKPHMGLPVDSSFVAKFVCQRWNTLKFEGHLMPNERMRCLSYQFFIKAVSYRQWKSVL